MTIIAVEGYQYAGQSADGIVLVDVVDHKGVEYRRPWYAIQIKGNVRTTWDDSVADGENEDSFAYVDQEGDPCSRLDERFCELAELVMCPAPCVGQVHLERVEQIIVHLNDDHGWSRENIASWLDDRYE